MKETIRNIISTKTFRQSLITSGGTIINGIFGLAFYVLVARFLGPSDFGVFSVATTTIALLASIFTFGVDTGLVRFVGRIISSEKEKALRFMKLGFKIKIISGIILVSFGWFLVPFLGNIFFRKPELIFPLRLALIGAFSWLLSFFVTSCFQTMQKFWSWAGLNVFMSGLRLLALGVLIYFGVVRTNSCLFAYLFATFAGFFLGIFFLPKFWRVKKENSVAKEFFQYNGWIAIFTVIVAISSRVDTYLSARLLNLINLGIYSVAVNLAGIVPEIVLALATVVAPKLAGFTNKDEALSYFKKLQFFVIGLAILGLVVGIPLSYLIIPHFYGIAYLPSIAPFVILLFAQAIFLISVPVHNSIFYYFSYPKIFVFIGLAHLILVASLGWYLIGRFGYFGAAWTMLIGNLFNFIVPGIWVLKKFQKNL